MNKKLTLNIEVTGDPDPVCGPGIKIMGNFNTEHIHFEQFAEYLGDEHDFLR